MRKFLRKQKKARTITSSKFDEKFDNNEDILKYLNFNKIKREKSK